VKIEGTHTFEAPRAVVWEALQDPEVLARTMPGCEQLERVGDNEYKGVMKIRVGTMQGVFTGLVTLSDLKPPHSYRMNLDGNGPLGFVRGEGTIQLEEQNDTTQMQYEGDAQVGGRIASLGQRLLDRSAKALTQQSLDGLSQQIQARQQAEVTGEPAPVIEAPGQTQFALGVARNLLDEMIPPERQPDLLKVGLILLAAWLLFRWLNNWWIERIARRVVELIEARS
jgi:uncharacterized protein